MLSDDDKIASAILDKKGVGAETEVVEEDALGVAADDLLSAVTDNDREGVKSALRAAFDILSSEE